MKTYLFVGMIIFLIFTPIYASSNLSEAKFCLLNAQKAIDEMKKANFSVQYVNDLYEEAYQLYLGAKYSENKDFSKSIEKCRKILELKNTSFYVYDEILALRARILSSPLPKQNLKEVWKIYNLSLKEFYSERYDKSLEYVNAAYAKLSELESENTQLLAIYEAAKENIIYFLKTYYLQIILSLLSLLIVILLFRRQIQIFLIKRKIDLLIKENKTLETLMKLTQKQYFEEKTLSEMEYKIRMEKYSELIREINKEIPLLKEKIDQLKLKVKIEKETKEEKYLKEILEKRKLPLSKRIKRLEREISYLKSKGKDVSSLEKTLLKLKDCLKHKHKNLASMYADILESEIAIKYLKEELK